MELVLYDSVPMGTSKNDLQESKDDTNMGYSLCVFLIADDVQSSAI